MRMHVARIPSQAGHVDPAFDRQRELLRLGSDINHLNERRVFFAAFDGDGVFARRDIDHKGMRRKCHVLFQTGRTDLPLVFDRRSLRRSRSWEIPFPIVRLNVDPGGNRLLRTGVDDSAAEPDRRFLSHHDRCRPDGKQAGEHDRTNRKRHRCSHNSEGALKRRMDEAYSTVLEDGTASERI